MRDFQSFYLINFGNSHSSVLIINADVLVINLYKTVELNLLELFLNYIYYRFRIVCVSDGLCC